MACKLETLLNASTCELRYCRDCNVIHLMMGSITLRLSADHFQELAQDLNKGLAQFKVRKLSPDKSKANNITILHS